MHWKYMSMAGWARVLSPDFLYCRAQNKASGYFLRLTLNQQAV